jgi:(R,R)-butanediol dehydrogenase/meso-butanediol dehydrogenase/diacetyl reductase
MKAARWHGRRDVRVEDVPVPTPARGEVLLRVSLCGICGTDLEEYRHGPLVIPADRPHALTGRRAPVTMGHEFFGVVAGAGAGVTGLREGDRVAPDICLFCNACVFCRRHQYALCENWATIGLHTDGGLAEYVTVPAYACVRLPDSLSDAEGALIEPTEVAVRAVNKAPPRLGDVVAVLGGGTIGLLIVQVSRAAGAGEVVVIEPRPARRTVALELGATAALDPTDPAWPDDLRRRAGGLGPDVVFECAGRPDSASLAIRMARKGGRIVLVGITGGEVPVDILDLLIGEKTVIGTIQHTFDEDLPAAVRLLADGRVRGRPLVTAEIPLADVVREGFEALTSAGQEHLKILVNPRA